jgi:heme/copper-type cytochrome/quinol oxidase subunit 3
MRRVVRHVLLPSIAPLLLVALYFTPKSLFGCANRGLMALALVAVALVASGFTTARGVAASRRGDREASNWWLATTLLLILPLVLLAGPLG